jgi:tetratricopeptide (TPR) repeat protein
MYRRALAIEEHSFGPEHPRVAVELGNLAQLLQHTDRQAEAEPLMRRALAIAEKSFGPEHPAVTSKLNNLARLLQDTNRPKEAESLIKRALAIDEHSFGLEHPKVATDLNSFAILLQATNRLGDAEALMRRAVEILLNFTRATSHPHPNLEKAIANYTRLLQAMGRSQEEIHTTLRQLDPEFYRE